MTMFIQADSFNLIRGALKSWTRDAASGAKAVCYFCPECGNRIYHVNPAKPEVLRLKPGALNDTRIIKPQSHAWVSRKQNWVEIPEGMPTHETQPEDLSDLIPSSNKQLAAD